MEKVAEKIRNDRRKDRRIRNRRTKNTLKIIRRLLQNKARSEYEERS